MTPPQNLREEPARFFSTLTSLNKFDRHEIRNVIGALLSPTQRELCFLGCYYRAFSNVESMLALNHPKHVQGIASAARGLFEVAVDLALIDRIPQGPEKMLAMVDVEKLRSARAVVGFKVANPAAQVDCDSISGVHQGGRYPDYCIVRFPVAQPAGRQALVAT